MGKIIDADDAIAAIAKLQQVATSCGKLQRLQVCHKNDDMYWICNHPNNNAWNIDENFFCGRGVKDE